ncbi:MAG TPA: hypothetical protein PKG77_23480, partial [Phycisphaerae bacterium]|nr:hypothetical protein [Phycisphaerae bacterium]HQL76302.1 hypothetical protein [Phycisphaerae bacterium]
NRHLIILEIEDLYGKSGMKAYDLQAFAENGCLDSPQAGGKLQNPFDCGGARHIPTPVASSWTTGETN